ncbi:MAG: LytR C-terminal domain-containing protein [Actinomycetota bacterium]
MNAATRGVILAIAAVIIGVIVLGQGFDDQSPTLTTASTSGDDGSQAASGDGDADDSGASADDSGASADDGSDDSGASADDSGAVSDDGAGDGSDDSGVSADDSGAADGSGDDSADTPSILHPPAEVRVLVANGTTVAGAAGRTADELQTNRGYNGLTPTNTISGVSVESSAIYYAAGYELDARQIAQILNAAPEAVAPMPSDPPVGDLAEAHVLVVLGPDLVSG